jgi:hypothetical protein
MDATLGLPDTRIGNFDPDKFVDRDSEQGIFEIILKFQDESRVLTITDVLGSGKSELLRRLRHNCQWRFQPEVPAALVHLNAPESATLFGLVSGLQESLQDNGLVFRNFNILNQARLAADPGVFGRAPSSAGEVRADSSLISGSGNQIAGIVQNGIFFASPLEWNPERDALARRKCIEAFLTDVQETAQVRPVVFLLDGFNESSAETRTWIMDKLIKHYCLAGVRSSQLVIVLAGEELPDFAAYLGEQRYRRSFRSIASLGVIRPADLRTILVVHKCIGLQDEDLGYLHTKLVKDRWPLRKVLRVAREFLA